MQDRWLTITLVVTTLVVALIGLLRPEVALRAVVILCLLTAAVVLIDAIRRFFARVPTAPESPFREPVAETPSDMADHELPWHYSGLLPSKTETPLLAPGAQTALRSVASELLWDRYRLNVWLPEHGPSIATVISEPLWAIINPYQPTPVAATAFSHSHLQRHLDELDAL